MPRGGRSTSVRNGKLTGLKDDESRSVPVGDSLAPVLRAWKLKTGGAELLFPPAPKANRKARFLDAETLGSQLHTALEKLGLLSPSHFGERELSAVSIDLSRPRGQVVEIGAAPGTGTLLSLDDPPRTAVAAG